MVPRWHTARVSPARVTLLTRAGCAACRTAAQRLHAVCHELGVAWTTVDVDEAAEAGDREPRAEFGDRLPVVLVDGREHSWGVVDESRLRRDLGSG